jgi:hypothetical protein
MLSVRVRVRDRAFMTVQGPCIEVVQLRRFSCREDRRESIRFLIQKLHHGSRGVRDVIMALDALRSQRHMRECGFVVRHTVFATRPVSLVLVRWATRNAAMLSFCTWKAIARAVKEDPRAARIVATAIASDVVRAALALEAGRCPWARDALKTWVLGVKE